MGEHAALGHEHVATLYRNVIYRNVIYRVSYTGVVEKFEVAGRQRVSELGYTRDGRTLLMRQADGNLQTWTSEDLDPVRVKPLMEVKLNEHTYDLQKGKLIERRLEHGDERWSLEDVPSLKKDAGSALRLDAHRALRLGSNHLEVWDMQKVQSR